MLQAACHEWARSQSQALEDLERLLGGTAQLLDACASAESAAARSSMLKVLP